MIEQGASYACSNPRASLPGSGYNLLGYSGQHSVRESECLLGDPNVRDTIGYLQPFACLGRQGTQSAATAVINKTHPLLSSRIYS
jgi:hypothetical protein